MYSLEREESINKDIMKLFNSYLRGVKTHLKDYEAPKDKHMATGKDMTTDKDMTTNKDKNTDKDTTTAGKDTTTEVALPT